MSATVPARLHGCTASTRLVYLALSADRWVDSEEVLERVGVSRSTLFRVIDTLRAEGVARVAEHPADGRRKLFTLVDGADTADDGDVPEPGDADTEVDTEPADADRQHGRPA